MIIALSLRAAGYCVENGLVVLAEGGGGIFAHHVFCEHADVCKRQRTSTPNPLLLVFRRLYRL